MEIVLEKSQVVDLRLDLHKQGISIGDDLNLVVNDQDQFILYFEPKRTIWSRFFYKLVRYCQTKRACDGQVYFASLPNDKTLPIPLL